jgi:hypothetical protein
MEILEILQEQPRNYYDKKVTTHCMEKWTFFQNGNNFLAGFWSIHTLP